MECTGISFHTGDETPVVDFGHHGAAGRSSGWIEIGGDAGPTIHGEYTALAGLGRAITAATAGPAGDLSATLTPAMVARFIADHNEVALGEAHAAVCALFGEAVGGRLWQAGRLVEQTVVSA